MIRKIFMIFILVTPSGADCLHPNVFFYTCEERKHHKIKLNLSQ